MQPDELEKATEGGLPDEHGRPPDVDYTLVTEVPERSRDEFGRGIIRDEPELWRLLRGLHRHRGLEATRVRVREVNSKLSLGDGGPGRVDKVIEEFLKV